MRSFILFFPVILILLVSHQYAESETITIYAPVSGGPTNNYVFKYENGSWVDTVRKSVKGYDLPMVLFDRQSNPVLLSRVYSGLKLTIRENNVYRTIDVPETAHGNEMSRKYDGAIDEEGTLYVSFIVNSQSLRVMQYKKPVWKKIFEKTMKSVSNPRIISSPDGSVYLAYESFNEGVSVYRYSENQWTNISRPTGGLCVLDKLMIDENNFPCYAFHTDTAFYISFYDGSAWSSREVSKKGKMGITDCSRIAENGCFIFTTRYQTKERKNTDRKQPYISKNFVDLHTSCKDGVDKRVVELPDNIDVLSTAIDHMNNIYFSYQKIIKHYPREGTLHFAVRAGGQHEAADLSGRFPVEHKSLREIKLILDKNNGLYASVLYR